MAPAILEQTAFGKLLEVHNRKGALDLRGLSVGFQQCRSRGVDRNPGYSQLSKEGKSRQPGKELLHKTLIQVPAYIIEQLATTLYPLKQEMTEIFGA